MQTATPAEPLALDRDIGLHNNLTSLRGSRSVEEVARAVGMTRMALYNIEKGHTMPLRHNLLALIRYYGSPVTFFESK